MTVVACLSKYSHVAYAHSQLISLRIPPEIFVEILKLVPIADLITVQFTSHALYVLAKQEIRSQIFQTLGEWVGNVDAFLGLLEVTSLPIPFNRAANWSHRLLMVSLWAQWY